jgi:hypothetical protein
MYPKFYKDGKEVELYYHKTDGGAEYLTDKYIETLDGGKEGIFKDANFIMRIDGEEPEIVREL